jgi:hypothetical protein
VTYTNFIALYRGRTVAESHLVAVTAEPEIVARFVRELTGDAENLEESDGLVEHGPWQVVQGEASE